MRLWPGSLSGRLKLAAAGAIIVALLLAGLAIAFILQRFVIGQVDQRLDTQIFAINAALQRNEGGQISIAPMLSAPPFDRMGSGWYWQVGNDNGTVLAASLGAPSLLVVPPVRARGSDSIFGRPASADGNGPHGEMLHWRVLHVPVGDQVYTIAATAPYGAIYGPLREALTPLALAILALGLLLFGATWVQVRLGLRPLENLRADLSDIRAGRKSTLDTAQPSEVRPLVNEVNSLLNENAEGLARARRHVANLAHGLKTPLAALSLTVEREGAKFAPESGRQLDLMDRLIRHHLARARAAALSGPVRARTDVAERLGDLVETMKNIHRDKGLQFRVTSEPGLWVAVETQDFDEIFGNLLDNAGKWACSNVEISAKPVGNRIEVTVRDDGPGIDEKAMPNVICPGKRIDEATPGYGFGLPIALELTELYAGEFRLSNMPTGGLFLTVALPRSI